MTHPASIRNIEKFLESLPAGFDGIFDWSFTKGCFGDTRIEPMDFDGVVERRGQFLVFETKDHNSLPRGQWITLKTAHSLGCFTIMIVKGKRCPERGRIWWPNDAMLPDTGHHWSGMEEAKSLVRRWFEWADGGPMKGGTA